MTRSSRPPSRPPEEAIVNALLAAGTMIGADGITAYGLDGDRVVEIMARHGRGAGGADRVARHRRGARAGAGAAFCARSARAGRSVAPAELGELSAALGRGALVPVPPASRRRAPSPPAAAPGP